MRAPQRLTGAEMLDIKQHFYHILLDIEANTILRSLLDMLNNRVSLLRALSMGREGRLSGILAELQEMVVAIEARYESRADWATRNYVARAADNVLSLLAQREAGSRSNWGAAPIS